MADDAEILSVPLSPGYALRLTRLHGDDISIIRVTPMHGL